MQCEELKKLFLNRPTCIKIGSAVLMTGLISYLKFRPIAILVSSVYVTWVYRTFYSQYSLQLPKELTYKCKRYYDNCSELRQNRPNVFCGFVASILFLVAVIGHLVSGTSIMCACLIAAVLLTSKYEIKIIKEIDASPCSGADVDEFCPRMDEANLMILKQIGDNADDTGIYSSPKAAENESDSDNELLPKNVVIPEPDDIDAVGDDRNLNLLMNAATSLTQSAEYKRKHFSKFSSDSSDSSMSDDSITRGLDFKNIPVTATIEAPSSTASFLTNIHQTIAQNLLDKSFKKLVVQSSQSKAFDSDDEGSDFEILDKDDLMK